MRRCQVQGLGGVGWLDMCEQGNPDVRCVHMYVVLFEDGVGVSAGCARPLTMELACLCVHVCILLME